MCVALVLVFSSLLGWMKCRSHWSYMANCCIWLWCWLLCWWSNTSTL